MNRHQYVEDMKSKHKTYREKFEQCPISPPYKKTYPCDGSPYLSLDNSAAYFYLSDAYGPNQLSR